MKLARIGAAGPSWRADDLSGAGAAVSPGRWNQEGEKVIYAAPTLAMAVLETSAHIVDAGLPLNKYVISIEVPDALWKRRTVITAGALAQDWDAIPCGRTSIQAGSDWYRSGASVLLELPSVIVPEESVVLINATHADAARITARIVRRFQYNLLFRGH
ncbi:RES family NAD+ phosphorylase [Stenotrophomonas sp. 24(2023)]|uniref:RES family NAD+ phosphorylase n=1 Tax=Stenotrophomonas sp. 24(2023) TaxID=3068324 RepID=UPI0027E0F25F|nr:RES family NAD+ phosphorylase [Stenotrophomonas sp. 24(2023)]WMJ70851.1 RES family NAD+ phosphorylase [Stenotrophomonas sp. 24(2023)]